MRPRARRISMVSPSKETVASGAPTIKTPAGGNFFPRITIGYARRFSRWEVASAALPLGPRVQNPHHRRRRLHSDAAEGSRGPAERSAAAAARGGGAILRPALVAGGGDERFVVARSRNWLVQPQQRRSGRAPHRHDQRPSGNAGPAHRNRLVPQRRGAFHTGGPRTAPGGVYRAHHGAPA